MEIGGPTGNNWVDFIILIAAALTALGVIWQKALRPMVRAMRQVIISANVIFDIAQQFHGNGGATLRDAIDRIEAHLTTDGEQIAAVVEKQVEQGRKLDELHEYAHSRHHENVAKIEGLAKFDEAISRKVDALAEKVDPLPSKLDEIKEGLQPTSGA